VAGAKGSACRRGVVVMLLAEGLEVIGEKGTKVRWLLFFSSWQQYRLCMLTLSSVKDTCIASGATCRQALSRVTCHNCADQSITFVIRPMLYVAAATASNPAAGAQHPCVAAGA
jgi:hypothetical protein